MTHLPHFQIAGGSVVGYDHVGNADVLKGWNNQDAFGWWTAETGDRFVAIVCDGCSGANEDCRQQIHPYAHSEVGAKIGVQILLARLSFALTHSEGCDLERLLETVRIQLVSAFVRLATALASEEYSINEVVRMHMLFTTVGAIQTPTETIIFSIGDGTYALNGHITQLGPFPGNAPPYLAYSLLNTVEYPQDHELLRFTVHERIPTAEVQSLMIGTDGVGDLLRLEEELIPTTGQPVGALAQFWEDSQFFRNRVAISRRLSLINTDSHFLEGKGDTQRLRRIGRKLRDDTTLIVARRNPKIKQV